MFHLTFDSGQYVARYLVKPIIPNLLQNNLQVLQFVCFFEDFFLYNL